MCRSLRLENRLKQRQVAEALGITPGAYGNTESSPFKVIGVDKVNKLISLYRLGERTIPRAVDLMAAWQAVPLSAYGEKQRKSWERRNRMRSKAKHHDRLRRSLAEILGLLLSVYIDENYTGACKCDFGDEELCEVCMALDNLGLDTYTDLNKAISDIAGLQTKMDAERAAAQNGATP